MGWATNYIKQLQDGKTVQFRPRGNSMVPRIKSGQLVTVVPRPTFIFVGDVVLCKVKGREYLHLIKAAKGEEVLIGNNVGGTNGWTNMKNVYGVVSKIE